MNSRFALISALFSTQTPPDDWPDALDHLAVGLVANKYTKLAKTSENLLLSQGVVLYKKTTVIANTIIILVFLLVGFYGRLWIEVLFFVSIVYLSGKILPESKCY